MLKTLYPALIACAKAELAASRESPDHAEDIVQAATTRWFEVTTVEERAFRYMRKAIHGLVMDLKREGADAMTHHPLSLETQIEEP